MKFYNREKELDILKKVEASSHSKSKMSVLIGRRRVGKTTLIKHAYPNCLYFFVARKSEKLLCDEFVSIIETSLDIKVLGKFDRFALLFEYLMEITKATPITLVVDEFQEFLAINPSVYSEIQNIWDSRKDNSKLNLVLCGSIYTLMKRIFEDKKEPLFGRADIKMTLKPFSVLTIKNILREHNPKFSSEDLLLFYTLTGGVAKYVELFVDNKTLSFDKMIDFFFDEFSLFIDEGKNLLIEEFGKDYTIYFSILSLIASSKTSRPEIESIIDKNIGGHLDRLEHEYTIIEKVRPAFSKEGGRIVKYEIIDNFFKFWFRFVYKNRSAIEIENYNYVKSCVKRDYKTYSGALLEKYFREKIKLSLRYSMIGNYWEKGNKNEIDIVAVNDEKKVMCFAEVKRNKNKINIEELKLKAQKLVDSNPKYRIEYISLGLGDM